MKQLFVCLAVAVFGAQAQGIHSNDLTKVPLEVVDEATKGVSPDLYVILDADAIYRRADETRRERGLSYSDQQLSDETAAEIGVGGPANTPVISERSVSKALAAVIDKAKRGQPNDLSKAPSDVVKKAASGISQELNVILDAGAIMHRALRKRRARGLKSSDRKLTDETIAKLTVLKASTFPEGRLGDAIVLVDHKHVPVLFVRVPDLSALNRIVADPRVIAVEPNQDYVPFGQRP
jgi:hypothetical protein